MVSIVISLSLLKYSRGHVCICYGLYLFYLQQKLLFSICFGLHGIVAGAKQKHPFSFFTDFAMDHDHMLIACQTNK